MPDLGVIPPKDGPCCAPSSVGEDGKPKKQYPSFSLRDEQVDLAMGENSCEVDTFYTATVKLRVAGINHDNYGRRLELEVQSLDGLVPSADGVPVDDDEENNEGDVPSPDAEAEKATLGYDRDALLKERAKKPVAPGGSAKDLAS